MQDTTEAMTQPGVSSRPYTPTRGQGAAAGVLAGAGGLAAAEVAVGTVGNLRSPIIGVGDKAIDLVPVPIKDFAIRTFGTNDKIALLVGIFAAIALFAVALGVVARKRFLIAVVGFVGFGAVGALAASSGRTGSTRDVIPSLVAAAVALIFFRILTIRSSKARRNPAISRDPSNTSGAIGLPTAPADHDRRGFLKLSGALAAVTVGAAAFGRRLQNSSTAVASRVASGLARPFKPLSPAPATVSAAALLEATPFFTPNKDFYRIDTALVVPKIDASTWKLTIKGMVDKETTYTYEDLLSRDLVERDITLTCVSNEVGGILMGNARWVGVPLRELLEEAGMSTQASQIVGRSVDGWSSGFPTEAVTDGRDTLVALSMNGEPLPFKHGFPARLIVPGLYGYVSATKWLTEIEVTTMEAFDSYWVPRGYAKEAPIKMASRIDVPRGLATVPAGRTAIAGIAWAQRTGISKVEIQIDGGEWVETDLAEEQSIDTWRQWSYAWDAPSGRHDIAVRATDKDGNLQIEDRVAPLPNGATGWHSIIVFVS